MATDVGGKTIRWTYADGPMKASTSNKVGGGLIGGA
jgi:hypothetical protein